MIEFRSLKPEEFEQWLEHVTFVFTKGTMNPVMRTYFITHFQNDPLKDFNNILVAVENGVILSTLKIIVRELFVNGELIKFGGIAEVSTKPDHCGKGYSGTLLKMAIRIMEGRAYHISMLNAGVPLYYSKYGWNKVNIPMKTVKVDYDAESSLIIRKVDFSTDMQSLINIWENYHIRFNGIVNRDREYWEKWYTVEGLNTYVALTPEGKCVSYICVNKVDDETVSLKEFGCYDGYEQTFEAISAEAIRGITTTGAVDTAGADGNSVTTEIAETAGADGNSETAGAGETVGADDNSETAEIAETAGADGNSETAGAVGSTGEIAGNIEIAGTETTGAGEVAATAATSGATEMFEATSTPETLKISKIKLPAFIETNPDNLIDTYINENMMARMIIPFKVGSRLINNSSDVVTLLEGGSSIIPSQSKYMHWDIDAF